MNVLALHPPREGDLGSAEEYRLSLEGSVHKYWFVCYDRI